MSWNIVKLKVLPFSFVEHVYILVSDFAPSDIEEFTSVKTDSQKTEYTILMSLLAMIEISNGKLDTEQALDGLRKIGFHNCEHKHKINDKDDWWIDIVKKDFMRQLYETCHSQFRSCRTKGLGILSNSRRLAGMATTTALGFAPRLRLDA